MAYRDRSVQRWDTTEPKPLFESTEEAFACSFGVDPALSRILGLGYASYIHTL
jgi:hypothetical protein